MITNTSKIGIDFDGIFVRDIPDFKMTDIEYEARIMSTQILKPSIRLLQIMENSDWYIVTGRKLYLEDITKSQLKDSIGKKLYKKCKGIYFNTANKLDHKHKIEISKVLKLDLFIESDKHQSKEINKYINCLHYENK